MLAEQYREVVLKPTTAFILRFCIETGLVYAVVSIRVPLERGVSTS